MTAGLVSPEERLLILMSLATRSDREQDEAKAAAAEVRDWDGLFQLADDNACAPLVWSNLGRAELRARVPGGVAGRFEGAAQKVREANEARLVVARELFARFAAQRIPVVILKGILFAETLYHDPYYKKMNDVDILVRRADLDAIYAIYDEMRFFSAAELVGGNPRKQEKFSHHAPPFFSRDLKCMIGTHWGLITPLAPYTIDYEAIWSRVVDIDFYGHPAKSMAPEDNLHHLCVHLPYYKTGVRELADIYNLVRAHEQTLDWDLFLAEVDKAQTWNLIHHALSLADRLCPMVPVQEAIRRVEPKASWYFKDDTARKTARIGRLLRSRSVHLSRIEKAFADLNATKKASEKWHALGRMWAGILAPPGEDVERMNALVEPGALDRLAGRAVTPWRICRVFARDVGAGMFVAIMGKSFYDCVKQTVRAPLGANGAQEDYASMASKLGVTVEDLQRLKDALE